MSRKYFYDDSGLPTSYLLLSIFLPLAVTLSYKYIYRKKEYSCKCINCLKHKKSKESKFKVVLLAVLWTVVSLLIKNVLTIQHKGKGYNPYTVLGVEPECTKVQLKSSFRKLALKNDPHRFQGEERKEAEIRLREIVKAYNLINEGIKIDTEASVEYIAIPDFMVTKGNFLLFLYFLFLGILLPRFAYQKYKSTNLKNRFDVNYKTTDSFYKMMINKENKKLNDTFIKNESFIRWLIQFITSSSDLEDHKYKKSINIKSLVEETFGYPLKEGSTAYFVLMDHLFRTEQADFSDLQFVQNKSLQIIQSLKEIAVQKENDLLLERLFTLERMIIQAVFDEEYCDMQKGDTFEEIFRRRKMKERKVEREFDFPQLKVKDIKAYVERTILLEDQAEQQNLLKQSVENQSNDDPKEMNDTLKKVTEKINDSVNSTVNITDKPNSFVLPCDSKITISFQTEMIGPKMIHAPFLKEDILTNWCVFLMVDNKLHDEFKEIKESNKITKFIIESKNKPMNVKLLFKTAGYFGIDKEESISIRIVK